jgi:hypothetical protein
MSGFTMQNLTYVSWPLSFARVWKYVKKKGDFGYRIDVSAQRVRGSAAWENRRENVSKPTGVCLLDTARHLRSIADIRLRRW